MTALTLAPLRFTPDELDAVVDLYRTNPAYCRAAGEYDPDDLPARRIADDLREEAATAGCEVLLARDTADRPVALVCLLDRHPRDGMPWIGLLLVDGRLHGRGLGRRLADLVEERYRAERRAGVGLAVLESNPGALGFWQALGWEETDRRHDVRLGRSCVVLHKALDLPG